ncbi:MAG: IS1595 family transposase [Chloroflexota bacterium]|nr:IS1595 family transposase [Chloroflexota bacterium]
MNIISIVQQFGTQESCIALLEQVKWQGEPVCPFCKSDRVARKTEKHHVGRWNCHNCLSTFKVMHGTIFERTKIPLPKWFAAIAILLNAKKSVSSYQLARDLDLTQPTAWYMAMRIRKAMQEDGAFLRGIVEADEAYLGGRKRKRNDRDDDKPAKRGPSGKKMAVLGAVERDGKVKATAAPRVTTKLINYFLRRNVDPRAMLITDQYPGYNEVRDWISHKRINHSKRYVDGDIHTNTIEGFWALVKRAIAGQHHHYTLDWADRYIDEATYKYNTRRSETPFADFMARACGIA